MLKPLLKDKSKHMRFFVAAIFAIILCSCQTKIKIRSEDNFAQLYLEALKKANPEMTFALNVDNYIITGKKGNLEAKYYVDDVYKLYRNNPNSIEEIISIHAASAEDFLISQKPAIENVVPLLKQIESLKGPNRQFDSLVFESYNDQLLIIYSLTSETTIKPLAKDAFRSLGITLDSLRKASLKNLDRIVPLLNRKEEDGAYIISAGGDFEASLVLLSSFWTKENLPVDGDFVVAIPTNNLLFVTGSNNWAQIKRLRLRASEEFRRGPYSVSQQLFKWTGSKFEVYE